MLDLTLEANKVIFLYCLEQFFVFFDFLPGILQFFGYLKTEKKRNYQTSLIRDFFVSEK